jgi:hypothetical protein
MNDYNLISACDSCTFLHNVVEVLLSHDPENHWSQKKKKLRGFSPLANYTDRAIAAGQRS